MRTALRLRTARALTTGVVLVAAGAGVLVPGVAAAEVPVTGAPAQVTAQADQGPAAGDGPAVAAAATNCATYSEYWQAEDRPPPPLPEVSFSSAISSAPGEVTLTWTAAKPAEHPDVVYASYYLTVDGASRFLRAAEGAFTEDPATGAVTATVTGLSEGTHSFFVQSSFCGNQSMWVSEEKRLSIAADGTNTPWTPAPPAPPVTPAPAPTPTTTVPQPPAPDARPGPLEPAVPAQAPADAELTLTTDKGRITTASAGEQITVLGSGFMANSPAKVVIYSEPRVLATVTTDGNGDFSAPVTVPTDLAAGVHSVVASGTAPDGSPRFLRMDVTVGAAPSATAPAARQLAYTGAEPLVPALLGAGALLGGGALLLAGRRRRTAQN